MALDSELLWLWCSPAATALIQLLAWERPYAAGAALKKKKKMKDKIVQPSDFAEEMETQEGEVRSTVSQLISCTCGGAWVRVCVHERVCSVCTCVRAGKGQGG